MGLLAGAAPIVEFAFWLGVAVTVATVIMLAVTITMRGRALHRDRVHAAAVKAWKLILVAEPQGEVGAVPILTDRDLLGFIHVWNDVHQSLRGVTTENLKRIALEVGLEERLHRLLATRTFHDRVVAIIALGYLGNHESFNAVAGYLEDKSPITSLCAARSLLQIDAERAVPMLVPKIVTRADWSQGSIAAMLQESAAAVLSGPLTEAVHGAGPRNAPRLIRLLAGVAPAAAAPIIRQELDSSTDERMISTCLQVISNRADLDQVRPLLSHPRWHIRMQAAVTLGQLGTPGDEQRLTALLSDDQWWVRYRAAQALANLEFLNAADLRSIQQAQTDVFAQDIIRHVLAERAIGAAS